MKKYYEQTKRWTCGPACARMMLDDLGIVVDEESLSEALSTMEERGTMTYSWKRLEEVYEVEVKTGNCKGLEDLEELRKGGWELTLMVYDGMPHYVRYLGVSKDRVTYWNPMFFRDGGMKKEAFMKRWKIDTDDYFEIGVLNGSRLVLDKWYVGIRRRP